MIFTEYAEKYGLEAARSRFGTTNHMVFTVYPKRFVAARCGRHMGTHPLGMGDSVEYAIECLKKSVPGVETYETIIAPQHVG